MDRDRLAGIFQMADINTSFLWHDDCCNERGRERWYGQKGRSQMTSLPRQNYQRRISLVALAITGLFACCGGAAAQNLVTDPDVANSPPWTGTGNAVIGDTTYPSLDPANTEGTDGLLGTGTLS